MNFSSINFWVFLLCGVGVVFLIRAGVGFFYKIKQSNLLDRVLLAALSLTLLGYESLLTLGIFLLVLLITYFSMMYIRHMPAHFRKPLLGILLFLQFAPLLYYKYANFLVNDVAGADISYFQLLVIPVGISFYTFQMVGFVIDYYHAHADYPSFIDTLNFSSFFPQIVAGPIERKERLLPQMERFRFQFSLKNIDRGLRWVVLGLFFKLCMADNVSDCFDWIWRASNNAYEIWLGTFSFTFRIYFDFAGYSLIALGLGKMFGVDLMLNFSSPYTATSIQEFWHRWHRSLSTWFRDYVYFPLGGSRSKRWPLNLLVVFVVSGIWHGSGWNFILWGTAHGVLLAIYRILKGRVSLPPFFAWVATMLFVVFTWLFFYQTDISILSAKLGSLLSPRSYGLDQLLKVRYLFGGLGNLINACCWLGLAMGVVLLEFLSCKRGGKPYDLFLNPYINILLAVVTLIAAPVVQNAFIYFSF